MAKLKTALQKQVDEERKIIPGIDPDSLDGKVVKVVKKRPEELAVKYLGKASRFVLTLGAFFLACVGLFTLIYPTVRQPLWEELSAAVQQILNFIR